MLSSCEQNPTTTVTDQFERLNRIKAESIDEMRRRMRKVKSILRDRHQKKHYEKHLRRLMDQKKKKPGGNGNPSDQD
jgi:predicted phage gp36 major capsid-like protein